MQILEIILYGKNGLIRKLHFAKGRVNIISGKSKTGKSVIGDIIDYCFGGDNCYIAEGVVRKAVNWYGLLLEHNSEYIFVARETPPSGQTSSGKCRYKVGLKEAPVDINLTAPIDTVGLEKLLSSKIGITENLYIPPFGQTRLPLEANIRHSLFYCIQNQDEIAAQKILFHRQSDSFMMQAIKDTIPYFFGIVNQDTIALEAERNRLKRQTAIIKRSIDEINYLKGSGMKRAESLLAEAYEVGILPKSALVDKNDYNDIKGALFSALNWKPIDIQISGLSIISSLQDQLKQYEDDFNKISMDIKDANEFFSETKSYEIEIQHQKNRLESIDLFEQLDIDPNLCPFCLKHLSEPLPTANDIRKSISQLSENLSDATKDRPKLRKHIDTMLEKQQLLREHISSTKVKINAIYNENEEAFALKDLNTRRARVVGRISLWLESVVISDNLTNEKEELIALGQRMRDIDSILSKNQIEEKKQSVISRLMFDMSKWAKELQLEHSEYPYRLDLNKVTVIVDKDRPVPLQQLGSGANWLGCH